MIVVTNIDEIKFECVYFLNIPTAEYSQCLDYGDNGQRLQTDNAGITIIFSSDEQLQLLSSATIILIDTTFKTVPIIYYQLFTRCVYISCILRADDAAKHKTKS